MKISLTKIHVKWDYGNALWWISMAMVGQSEDDAVTHANKNILRHLLELWVYLRTL
jgi:hypothetical protein